MPQDRGEPHKGTHLGTAKPGWRRAPGQGGTTHKQAVRAGRSLRVFVLATVKKLVKQKM